MPEKYKTEDLNLAARVTSQTFQALELSGQRVTEAALLFSEGRLVLKNFRGGTLIILCARNINIPLLNLSANVAVKKLVAETRSTKPAAPILAETKPPAATDSPAPASPASPESTVPSLAAPVVTPTPLSPSAAIVPAEVVLPPLVDELEKSTQQILAAASNARIPLWVMDPIALWHRCRGRRRLLTIPQQRQMIFVGQSEQLVQITQLFANLGYQRKTPTNAPPTIHRLLFTDPRKSVNLVLLLDTFEMYHRFDFKPFLHANDPIVPATVLVLARLQLVEMPDEALSDLAALFIEYDVSLVPKANQIDASQITALGVDDWGWYKTISINLEQLIYFAEDSLLLAERNVVIERARRLKSGMDASPKSFRWQARARLGETVRWYETPVEAGATTRPDMAIGS
jgi:hypothetical protein